MIKILLPFVCFFSSDAFGGDDDRLSAYNRQFATVTREVFGSGLPVSPSDFALDAAANGRSSPLEFFIRSGGASPDSDEYEARITAIMDDEAQKKVESRPFDKEGLANFILRELKINPAKLDESAGTVLDQINAVERLINVHLKTLNDDLVHVFSEKSELSKAGLVTPDLIKRRYENAVSTIREVMHLSSNSQETMLNLAFLYFVMNVSGVIGAQCKILETDSQEVWQVKSDILQRNIKSLQGIFATLSLDERKNTTFRIELEKIIQIGLIAFYNESCDFFAKWYKSKRSTWHQGLQLLGARDSTTKKLFENFDSSYRTLFAFLFDDALTRKRLDAKKGTLLTSFDETEKGFSEGISSVTNMFGFLGGSSSTTPASTSTAPTIAAPQPTKAAASGWGSWWGS